MSSSVQDAVEEWPGVTPFDATLSGGHITATRPKHFFRGNSSMPEVVSLPIARPHGFEDLGQSEWANLVTDRVPRMCEVPCDSDTHCYAGNMEVPCSCGQSCGDGCFCHTADDTCTNDCECGMGDNACTHQPTGGWACIPCAMVP